MRKNLPVRHRFSIQRHAVQRLLRLALDAAPAPVSGLLGGHDDVVDCVFPLAKADDVDEVRDTLLLCRQQGRDLLATYASTADSVKKIAAWQAENFPDKALDSILHVQIRTDTDGRIEAELHAGSEPQGDEIWPLEMQEDGGLYPTGDNS